MKKYWEFFKIGYQLMMTYRSQVIFGTLRHLIVVIMAVILWATLFKDKGSVDGYNFKTIVTYYILVELIDIFYLTASARILTRDINTGELTNYLSRPLNYWGYLVSHSFGSQVGYVSLGVVFLFIAYLLFPSFLLLQSDLTTLLLTLFMIVLSSLVYFQIFYVVGCITFWVSETTHLRQAIKQLISVLGGRWVPIVFFPLWAQEILKYTPFPYLFGYVVRTYEGKASSVEALYYIAMSFIWFIILFLFSEFLWRKGIKNFASYGK